MPLSGVLEAQGLSATQVRAGQKKNKTHTHISKGEVSLQKYANICGKKSSASPLVYNVQADSHNSSHP